MNFLNTKCTSLKLDKYELFFSTTHVIFINIIKHESNNVFFLSNCQKSVTVIWKVNIRSQKILITLVNIK